MTNEIAKLQPTAVWHYFSEILAIARPSKKEGKILEYLKQFAEQKKLQYKQDAIGNIVIIRPSSAGKEACPTVVLQSHVDMVCEKNSDVKFNFDTDPINAYISEDGWVKARGTTLGADCGIGMAAELAILADTSLQLPCIEALFTVDEETGLTGAFNIAPDLISGKYLINLDSEDEGELFIGCAGGVDSVATFNYEMQPVKRGHVALKINISGLQGGHSGDDINRSYANSNRLLARFLFSTMKQYDLNIHRIDGGNLRNAIPREAEALITIPSKHKEQIIKSFNAYSDTVKQEFKVTEPNLKLAIAEAPAVTWTIDKNVAEGLVTALFTVPNGVEAMSQSIPDLVETSTNLASVKMLDGNKIVVCTSQRSALESKKMVLATIIRTIFESNGAKVKGSDGYPGWEPRMDSTLLTITERSYTDLFAKAPKVKAIHAGLECGLFLKKYPDLDMISIGPTLRGVHSPDERLEIATVGMFYDLLVSVLRAI